jgi:signal transduction histidine kinase
VSAALQSRANHHSPVKPNILGVDDSLRNLLVLETLLASEEYVFTAARSGVEALALAAIEEYAVIVLDVRMPDIDGFETAARLRSLERSKATPIIMVTAEDLNPGDLTRGYQLGAVDFLVKPIDPVALRTKVSVFVELFNSREAAKRHVRGAAMVAHDLRGPLGAVAIAAKLIEMSPELGQVSKRHVGAIHRGVERMEHIVRDLLDLGRIELSDGIPIAREQVDMNHLVLQLVEEIKLTQPELEVHVHLPSSPTCTCDPSAMGRAVANIIRNAAQHGDRVQPITVRMIEDGDELRIDVHNFGAPISSELIGRLFEPFQQGSRSSKANLGLGLYIANAVVKAHGGQIDVSSSQENGTTFAIRVPLSERAIVISGGVKSDPSPLTRPAS